MERGGDGERVSGVSILEREPNHFQTQGHILACGDRNARTGQEPNILSTKGDKRLPGGDNIPSPICPPRHNYDNITSCSVTRWVCT